MKTATYIILAFSLLINSCNKDDDTSPEPTTSELLISGKWFFNRYNNEEINSCERQSYFHFTDFNSLIVDTFSINSSTSSCQSSGLSAYTYVTKLANEIIATREGVVVVYKITVISRTNLTLTRQIPSGAIIEIQFIK